MNEDIQIVEAGVDDAKTVGRLVHALLVELDPEHGEAIDADRLCRTAETLLADDTGVWAFIARTQGGQPVGVLMLKVIGIPIAQLMTFLGEWLQYMNTGNAVVLAMILGAMIAFDMGGPVNKAAFFFGAAMIKEGHYGVMGICAAAICTPPLGLGTATLINRKLWSDEEKEAGIAAVAMGMIGITEGAIPFAAADPLRVIPCIMAGSMTAAVIASLGGVGDHAPHGGPIVLLVVDNRIMFVIAIAAGTIVTSALINTVKVLARKRILQTTETPS